MSGRQMRKSSPSRSDRYAKFRVADARAAFAKYRLKDRLQDRPASLLITLEHLRSGRLLLQRFGKVACALLLRLEQPRVLNGDDGLGGKVLHQCNLFFGERPNLLAIDGDDADHLVILEHRHPDQSAGLRNFDRSDTHSHAVGRCFAYVIDLNHFPVADDTAGGVLRSESNKGLGEKIFAVLRRSAVYCDDAKFVAFAEPKIAKFGLADARCILQDRLENWLQVSGRRADDTQNFRCGRLLLQGLVPLAGKPRDLCSWPAAEELRRRATFGALLRFSVIALRRRVLIGSPPALERRLIGSP